MTDLKHAVRSLVKAPQFAVAAVLTLAVGIGANTVTFTGIYRLLFDPMPYAYEVDRLVTVWEVGPRGNDHNEVALGNFRDWSASARSFTHLAAHTGFIANLSDGDRPERAQGFRVTANYFDTLGVQPALGRTFATDEEHPGRDAVVILSHGLWQRRFGGDPRVVGRRITVNGGLREVVGVMPEAVRYPAPAELWAPLAYSQQQWENRRAHFLLVTGRLAAGASSDAARTELATLAGRLAVAFPATNTGWGANVQPRVADVTRTLQPLMIVLAAAVGFVLLIGCANVANLLLARGTARRHEFAVRASLGASWGRLQRQLLTESLVLAAAGGGAGLLWAFWGVQALGALVPAEHRRFVVGFDRLEIDGVVVAFTAGLTLLTAVVFGALPAFRVSSVDLLSALQPGLRSVGSRLRHRLRSVLVAAEVTLALLLVLGAGMSLRGFQILVTASPGLDPEGVAVTSVSLPSQRYGDPSSISRFYDAALARIAVSPGVTAAAAANIIPLCQCNQTTSFAVAGRPPFPAGEQPDVGYRVVSPAYFDVFRIPMREGRAFASADTITTPPVVIVNETLARRYFPEGSALGQRLLVTAAPRPAEIVGIVSDVLHKGPTQPAEPELYLASAQTPVAEMTLVARTDGNPASVLPLIRNTVVAIDAAQPVFDQRTMRDVVHLAIGPLNLAYRLLTLLAVAALFLATVGIYAVIAHIVSERRREIGLRLALGGPRTAVVRTVVAEALRPAAWGLGVGLVGGIGVARGLRSLAVGVSLAEPGTFIGAALVLLLAALTACFLPARRASRVDPMMTLRGD